MKTTNIFYRALCLVLMALCSAFASGQNSQTDPLQFYSPNTYAFARYGDLPVNYSTGVPDIQIPLTSITDKDVSLDISLSYHAAGIKVDQEAGWVGLGWSLNAGGVITSQVRGVPDYMNSTTGKMPRTNLRFHTDPNESLDDYIDDEAETLRLASLLSPLYEDTAPDIFYFNFCGKSGKFYLDEDGKGHMLDQEDWLIAFQPGGTFSITDEKGVVYEFADLETAYSSAWNGYYTTGWYLSSITSPTGGSLAFTYTTGGTLAAGNLHRTYTSCYMAITNRKLNEHEIPMKYRTPSFTVEGSVSGKIVSRITASSGAYVSFTCKNEVRKDAMSVNGNMLEYITSYNSAGTAVKKYKLSYSYFEPDSNHRLSNASFDCLNYRLRLDSVQEVAASGSLTVPPYTFVYYGDDGTAAHKLPFRMSPCQDQWGYYNYTANTCLFPNNGQYDAFHIDPWYAQLAQTSNIYDLVSYKVTGGGDRSIHAEATKACTLKKITYPTGGYTEFDFENHDPNGTLGNLGMNGLRIKKITDNDGNGNSKVRQYEYGSYDWESGQCMLHSNLFHTAYHQALYDNNTGQSAGMMAAYGVPQEFLNSELVLEIKSFPTVTLGVEGDFLYPNVREYVTGQGYTDYTFSYSPDQIPSSLDGLSAPDWFNSGFLYIQHGAASSHYFYGGYGSEGSCVFPYMNPVDLGWKRGRMTSRKVYSQSGALLESDRMTYEERILHVAPGYKCSAFSDYEFLFSCDYVLSGMTRLTSEEHYEKGVTTLRTYTYDGNHRKQVSTQTEMDSHGTTLRTEYRYPSSYGTAFSTLKNKNILSAIDVRTYRNGVLVSGIQTAYNASGQPVTGYSAEPTGSDISFSASSPYTFTPVVWRTYDSGNRLVSETFRSEGKDYAYLWAYGGQYPVAKIEGATSTEVSGWLGSTAVNALVQNSTSVESVLSNMRNTLSSKGVLVTTYTYTPGVGMTSVTAPNGQKTTYTYDSLNRLSQVRDDNSQIVNLYDYNYQQ